MMMMMVVAMGVCSRPAVHSPAVAPAAVAVAAAVAAAVAGEEVRRRERRRRRRGADVADVAGERAVDAARRVRVEW